MEAGNRCFDQRVPEETNRKIVDHIADINLLIVILLENILLREGFLQIELLKQVAQCLKFYILRKDDIEKSDVLRKIRS
jgi:hypothetical protein